MDSIITSKLLPYQVPHTLQLYECLLERKRVLDASDTGTGKTYCALAACKMLKFKPFIICPKSVISNWVEICKFFELDYLGIANYEMIKNGKYYTENYEPVNCPYMDKQTKSVIDPKTKKETKENEYEFYLPNDTLVIFDEAHRCKNSGTDTSKLLIALNKNDLKIMLLSATISDKINCFKPFGVIFGFYKDISGFRKWISDKKEIYENKKNSKFYNNFNYNKYLNFNDINDSDISTSSTETSDDKFNEKDKSKLEAIHNAIFPNYGSRMKIKELGDLFPQNTISANCYNLTNKEEVDKIYDEINQLIKDIKNKETKSNALAKLIRARQKVEMLKIPLFLELAEEALESNYSIVIFVNYLDTLEQIQKELSDYVPQIIKGGQSIEERTNNINNFQSNKSKVLIAMCQAGNVGISLHDIHGGHPRMSIISPTWSGQDMKQVLGRIHRSGAKSPAIQKIVYVAKTYEEDICKLIKNKLTNIDAINDAEFAGPQIKKEELEEIITNKIQIPEDIPENNSEENKTKKSKGKKITVKKYKKTTVTEL